jgi:tRNA threonylcarbamoyl adenosine modification protein YeaZ
MLILSIDQSTATGSAAILDTGRVKAERHWLETRGSRQQMFPNLMAMLNEVWIESRAIQLYVVGVGPGSYSGLRVALAAVGAMALPGGTSVYGITSAEGLAWQAAETARTALVRIVGDARREQWWTRAYRFCDAVMKPVDDWKLVHPRAFKAEDAAVVATPDWARIGPLLRAVVPADIALIERAIAPEAAILARLTLARIEKGIPSERVAPIYLHPAVHVKSDGCQTAGPVV